MSTKYLVYNTHLDDCGAAAIQISKCATGIGSGSCEQQIKPPPADGAADFVALSSRNSTARDCAKHTGPRQAARQADVC